MVSTTKINRKLFSVCYFHQRHTREVLNGHNCKFESTHGSKNGRTHFARVGMGKLLDRNRSHNIVLTNDPWRSTPQSPVGPGAALGPVIGPRVGTLNCAPEYFCTQRRE